MLEGLAGPRTSDELGKDPRRPEDPNKYLMVDTRKSAGIIKHNRSSEIDAEYDSDSKRRYRLSVIVKHAPR
jgi:hypothetical protein